MSGPCLHIEKICLHLQNTKSIPMLNPLYKASDSRYQSAMTYERCGRSGLLLPRISLGLWHNFGDVNTLANSRDMLHFAFDYLAAHDTPCLIYQGRYNMIDRNKEHEGIVEQAARNGVGFTAFSPLEQGILTSRYLNGIPEGSRASRGKALNDRITPEVVAKVRLLDAVAAERGQSLAQMALAWLLKDSGVTSVIIGSSSVSQIRDSLGCLENLSFSAEELSKIDTILFPAR